MPASGRPPLESRSCDVPSRRALESDPCASTSCLFSAPPSCSPQRSGTGRQRQLLRVRARLGERQLLDHRGEPDFGWRLGRRLRHVARRRRVVRDVLRRPVPAHRLRRRAVHRIHRPEHDSRVREQPRLHGPRSPVRHRRHRQHRRERGGVPDRRLEIAYETTAGAYDLSNGVATFSGGDADTSGALTLASAGSQASPPARTRRSWCSTVPITRT